LLVIFYKIYLL